jgi:transposase
MRQVWVQKYYLQDEEVIWRQSDNVPPSELSIHSSYDVEARFSIKRQTEWLGYKAHLTETCDEDRPNLINSQEQHGVEVIGPIKVDTTWQAQLDKGFDVSCFTIDWDQRQVTCPKGRSVRFGRITEEIMLEIPASTFVLPKRIAWHVWCAAIVLVRRRAAHGKFQA